MNFQFESLSTFIDMGGHGAYVWSCYLLTVVALLLLMLYPRARKRQLTLQLQRQQRIEQGQPVAPPPSVN